VRTELHFHLLPSVDDGPATDHEAVELARLAVEDGTGRVVCTPHVRELDLSELPGRVQRLRELLESAELPLAVAPGGELSPQDVATAGHSELELVAQGPPEARWVLLEVPLWHRDMSFPAAAAELRERGFGILIGHPERGSDANLAGLDEQVRAGAILQLSASSLAGLHGPQAALRAIRLARAGHPFVISSDAHSLRRPPLLSDARRRLLEFGFAEELVNRAIDSGPAWLFEHGLRPGEPDEAHMRVARFATRRAA
jgi:protein-tyrosine phosphatase